MDRRHRIGGTSHVLRRFIMPSRRFLLSMFIPKGIAKESLFC
jgi:hypothetical protein